MRLLYDAIADTLDSPRRLIAARRSFELPDHPELYATFRRDRVDKSGRTRPEMRFGRPCGIVVHRETRPEHRPRLSQIRRPPCLADVRVRRTGSGAASPASVGKRISERRQS